MITVTAEDLRQLIGLLKASRTELLGLRDEESATLAQSIDRATAMLEDCLRTTDLGAAITGVLDLSEILDRSTVLRTADLSTGDTQTLPPFRRRAILSWPESPTEEKLPRTLELVGYLRNRWDTIRIDSAPAQSEPDKPNRHKDSDSSRAPE